MCWESSDVRSYPPVGLRSSQSRSPWFRQESSTRTPCPLAAAFSAAAELLDIHELFFGPSDRGQAALACVAFWGLNWISKKLTCACTAGCLVQCAGSYINSTRQVRASKLLFICGEWRSPTTTLFCFCLRASCKLSCMHFVSFVPVVFLSIACKTFDSKLN